MKAAPWIIAHRGASGLAPENTLASVQEALKIGARMIEIDIHTTKDGEIVVMHDADVSRTTNGVGLISQMTLEEIRSLDAGSWFGAKFSGEKVPTLDEVLRTVKGKADLCVEVKDANPRDVLRKLMRHNFIDHVILFDFDHDRAYEAKKIQPNLRTLLLGTTHASLSKIDPSLCDFVGSAYSKVDESLVKRVHDLGLQIFVYTVNEENQMKEAVELGVDALITNFPNRAFEVLHSVS